MAGSTFLHRIPEDSPFEEDGALTSRVLLFEQELGYHPIAIYRHHRFQLIDAGARTVDFDVLGPGDSWMAVSSGHANDEVIEYEGPSRGFRFTMSATGSGAKIAVVSYPAAV